MKASFQDGWWPSKEEDLYRWQGEGQPTWDGSCKGRWPTGTEDLERQPEGWT